MGEKSNHKVPAGTGFGILVTILVPVLTIASKPNLQVAINMWAGIVPDWNMNVKHGFYTRIPLIIPCRYFFPVTVHVCLYMWPSHLTYNPDIM